MYQSFDGISNQLMAKRCMQEDYDFGTENAPGYKTPSDWSDDDTMYQTELQSHALPCSWVVNAHLPAYTTQLVCPNTVKDVMQFVNAGNNLGQGYACFQPSEDAFQWCSTNSQNGEISENWDCPQTQGKCSELTRTQRRRAERRRAEQRRRLDALTYEPQTFSSALEMHDVTNAAQSEEHSLTVATPTQASGKSSESAEITRTQRRRLQRRRAEQRLQLQMQQGCGEDDDQVAYLAEKFAKRQEKRRNDKHEARKGQQGAQEDQWQSLETEENAKMQNWDVQMPVTHMVSDAGSTCASTQSNCDDASSATAEWDIVNEGEDDAKYSVNDLLKWRPNRTIREKSHLTACYVKDCPQTDNSPRCVSEMEECSLEISTNSWVASQTLRRSSLSSGDQILNFEEIVRKMKSILNKLTVEKFPALSKQLVCLGIRSHAHLETLVSEIVAKASTQHHFVDMYADLCAMLHAHISSASNDSNMNVKKLLLNACQVTFESHIAMTVSAQAPENDNLDETKQMHKFQMIGNIKFVGALLLRKMLASRVMFYIFEELLSPPYSPEGLESFAAFLTVVGPGFDHPQHIDFQEIFEQAAALATNPDIKPRLRWLIKDVLDLRAAGWQDSKPKQLDSPSTLEDVAKKFHAQVQPKTTQQAEQWSSRASASHHDKHTARQTNVVDNEFDKAAMHKELALIFRDLLGSQDVRKAVSRISTLDVPPQLQVEQLRDLLQFMSEMKVESVRALGFTFIVTIFTERCWMPSAFEDGFLEFARLCVEGKVKTPTLAKIIQEEMIPAFRPLANRGMMLSSFSIQDLLRRLA